MSIRGLFDDVMFKSFPDYKDNLGRTTLRTNVILMDDPESDKRIGVSKVGELDFWNDISGFFHSNKNHRVYNFNNASVEIPDDIEVTHFNRHGGLVDGFTIGSVIIDQEYNVYVVHSFHSASGGSDIYWNYVNPDVNDYLCTK